MSFMPDEPLWGIVLRIWPDTPIYHRIWHELGRQGLRTACGRPVGLGHPMLPMKHVKKFCRPCKGCFK